LSLGIGLMWFQTSLAIAQTKPLWVLDVSVVAAAPLDLDRALRVRLYSDAPEKLAAPLPGVQSVAADSLVLDLTRAPVLSSGAPAATEATFLVDYDSESVAELSRMLVERFGETPGNDDLVDFVRDVVDPTHGRGFDIASQVASHRSGDCTEHAVLLAALARSVGLPARVAVGSVIIHDGEHVGAYGHAWTELHRDGVWALVDATPLGDDVPLSYVPEGLIEDEGPGYMFGFMASLASGILRVEVLGNVPDAGS
jgi:hypothetical protein